MIKRETIKQHVFCKPFFHAVNMYFNTVELRVVTCASFGINSLFNPQVAIKGSALLLVHGGFILSAPEVAPCSVYIDL